MTKEEVIADLEDMKGIQSNNEAIDIAIEALQRVDNLEKVWYPYDDCGDVISREEAIKRLEDSSVHLNMYREIYITA